jgi:hypothetical protein
MQHHNYNLSDLDYMVPWEREIYVLMLNEHIQKENQRIQSQSKIFKG